MSILVQFTSEKKRVNSTKQLRSGKAIDCDLKYPVSVTEPILLVSMPPASSEPSQWSGAWISEFNRYYYVVEATSVSHKQWEIHLTVDVLATYKEDVLASKAMVIRASGQYNVDLVDTMLPTTVSQESETKKVSFLSLGGGAYVLTVVGGSGGAGLGGVGQYVLDDGTASSLSEALNEPSVLEQVKEYFANPYDCVIGLIWQPVNASEGSAPIKIGGYDTGVSGGVAPKTPTHFSTTISAELPYSDYRRKTQTEITLTLPGVGAVEIDPTILVYRKTPLEDGLLGDIPKGFSIRVDAEYDVGTGDIHYNVTEPNSGSLILLADGNIAVQLMTGMRASNVGQALTAITMATGAALGIVGSFGAASVAGVAVAKTAQYAMGVGGSTIGMLTNGLVQMNRQTPYITGKIGGRAAAQDNKNIYLTIRARSISQSPTVAATTIGLPVYRVANLSTFSGAYVVCTLSDFQTSATSTEKELLYSLVNGTNGIYLE